MTKRGCDDGQSLVIALLFLCIFSLLIAGLLGLATTGSDSVVAVNNQRTATYAADSAVQGAIAAVRVGTACPSPPTAILSYQPSSSASSVSVTCTASTLRSDEYVTFTATENSRTVVTAVVVIFNSLVPPYTDGTQPTEVTSWKDATD